MTPLETGHALYLGGRFADAIPHLEETLRADPTSVFALTLMGGALSEVGRVHDGAVFLGQAIALDPTFPQAMALFGCALIRMGMAQESLEWLNKSLKIVPDFYLARWNRAQANLMAQNWREGWEDYEWGKVIKNCRPNNYPYGHWSGQKLGPDQTLLIWGEQGAGDVIQFARFIQKAQARAGCKVLVQVKRPLVRLIKQAAPDAIVFGEHETFTPMQPWDFQVSMASLPYVLGEGAGESGWLQPPCNDEFKGKTGLCWAGNPTHANDHNRSVPVEMMKPLEGLADFVRLGGPGAADLPFDMPVPQFGDYWQTAQAIAGMDRVITVDTSVAHIAGSMNKETWLINQKTGEWRWGHEERSPWYPSVRIYRPTMQDGFEPIIAQIAADLRSEK
jgi:hypothetical protein